MNTIPGDFANEKRPTDSTVVVGGAAAAAGSGNAASGAQSTNASVDAPRYTDGAETVKGSGKYFDPKDTQEVYLVLLRRIKMLMPTMNEPRPSIMTCRT